VKPTMVKTPSLEIIGKKLFTYEKLKLIRIPYYNPKAFVNSDKHQPDDRELEEIDPVFKLKQDKILKLRNGVPVILEYLVNSLPN
jgi:hypothetical protein